MSEVTVRTATQADAYFIGRNLRAEDRTEIIALGLDPEGGLELSRAYSEVAYTACVDGVPAMMFGFAGSILGDTASIWALGTDLCSINKMSMVKVSRRMLKKLMDDSRYTNYENYVDFRYKKALKWLELLGFTVEAPKPYGVNGELFCRVSISKRR
jgi:hypothetical protein